MESVPAVVTEYAGGTDALMWLPHVPLLVLLLQSDAQGVDKVVIREMYGNFELSRKHKADPTL